MAIVVINIKSALCARHKSAERERERGRKSVKWTTEVKENQPQMKQRIYILFWCFFCRLPPLELLMPCYVYATWQLTTCNGPLLISFSAHAHTHTHVCHFFAVQYFIIRVSALHLLQEGLSIGHGQVDRPVRDIWIINTTVRTVKSTAVNVAACT